MGHPTILYTSHQIHALLNSPRFVLKQARKTGYEVVLSVPELNIQRCNTVNPATRMMIPIDGTPHDCLWATNTFLKPREDMHNQPITADFTLFVDGSCFRDATGNHAGYAIIQLLPDDTFTTVQMIKLAQPCSAQLAEINALTAACKLARGKRLNVYTDSQYAYAVCHVHGNVWKQRGFLRADGTPVTHGEAILRLLKAIHLPSALAIIKCAAHQKRSSLIAKGNNLADEAAKPAATSTCVGPLLVAEDCEQLTTLSSLIAAQNMAGIYEQSVWLKRGATKTTQEGPHKGLWCSVHGHFVLPTGLLKIAIHDAHGSDHCARGEVIGRLQTVWWALFLASTVDKTLAECDVCAHHNVRKAFSAPIAHIPPPSGPFRHLMMDHVDMTERVKGFRYLLVVVDRFSRWVEAVPTKGPDCRSAAKFLCKEVFPRFGLPDCISSDNRPSFVADMMKVSMKMLGIKQMFGCVYHPQSQRVVEHANGTLKAKLAKIMAGSKYKFKWVDALPLALMSMQTQANRLTHLTPHEMITGRPMPVPYLRGPYNGQPLEQCEKELTNYLQHLTQIHKVIFQQVKSATEERDADIPDKQQRIVPGDWVYVKVFKRKWDQPRRQGPFKVTLATPTALKVEGKSVWFHLNHCCQARKPARKQRKPERDGNSAQLEDSQPSTPQE